MSTVIKERMAVEVRARASGGVSTDAVLYELVRRFILTRHARAGVLVDIGCGQGKLYHYLGGYFDHYVGADLILYDQFPQSARCDFHRVDLESGKVALPDDYADVVCSLETIEHVENPRALMRELVRLAKPGGCVIVTTPNQLSLLSLLTLALKHRFAAFQDVHYPAHITALLEVDLQRIAVECGLAEVGIDYSGEGRIVLTPYHYPQFLSRLFPRALSDNVLLIGKKPSAC